MVVAELVKSFGKDTKDAKSLDDFRYQYASRRSLGSGSFG